MSGVDDVFDPDDKSRVTHTKIGLWDFYQPIKPKFTLSGFFGKEKWRRTIDQLPYATRFIGDVLRIEDCAVSIVLYLSLRTLSSLIPALLVWNTSRFIKFTQSLLQGHDIDTHDLFRNIAISLACRFAMTVLGQMEQYIQRPLRHKIDRHFSHRARCVHIRLDVPTSEDSSILSQLGSTFNPASVWYSFTSLVQLMSSGIRIVSHFAVLLKLLYNEQPMLLYVISGVIPNLVSSWDRISQLPTTTWAATCRNADYHRFKALESLARQSHSRQELVAGNLQAYVESELVRLQSLLGSTAMDFRESYNAYAEHRFNVFKYITPLSWDLSMIVFGIQALMSPLNLPNAYASRTLAESASSSLSYQLIYLRGEVSSLSQTVETLKQYYDALGIQNIMQDGTIPFPENQQSLRDGISIEFKNVSFKYPTSDSYALRNVSFILQKGQLCVIVGTNGSGKSTLLKLILRIYDPTEGQILIDGQDLRTLRMSDIRRAVTSLFQTYSTFPVSTAENIGMGDPEHVHDLDRVIRAAELGGATKAIERLPKGFDTYLEPQVRDVFCSLPPGTKSLFGVKNISHLNSTYSYSYNWQTLSGGEYQRLALARTFMKTMNEEHPVGLLLFDEPSASLDPNAEFALFERMTKLRGTRSMIFSSHRFGNLTKHADVILFMKDSTIMEIGTHGELLKKDGEYASMYNVQAAAFM